MSAFVTAGAGFLLAVLWFDLMFDVQVLAHRGARELPEEVLASIAAYYRRVTTAARPMNRLIAGVMLATIAATVLEIVRDPPTWLGWASLALIVAPVSLAAARTVPSAVRLGSRSDPPAVQSALARGICAEHIFCLTAIASLIGVQLAFGR